jgi:hypothetical protein
VGQVEKIGLDVIQYRTTSDGHLVLIEADKHDLSRVKLKGGLVLIFTPDRMEFSDSSVFMRRKHALSVDVIAPR